MATPQPNMADSEANTVNGDEKIALPKDTDSSSGHVDTIEEAVTPGANVMVVDKATERAVLRKLDYRIVPMICWIYLMNMMDRGEVFPRLQNESSIAILTTALPSQHRQRSTIPHGKGSRSHWQPISARSLDAFCDLLCELTYILTYMLPETNPQ